MVWGFNWIASKWALDELPPLAMMTIRFLLVAIAFSPFIRWHRGEMRLIGLIALFGGALHFGLGFVALSMADDITPLAIAGNLAVPFATLLSAVFLGDRIGVWRGSALVLAFAGVVVLGFDARVLNYLDAVIVNTMAAFCWAGGTILLRLLKTRVSAMDIQGWMALGAVPPVAVASYLFEPNAVASIGNASLFTWGCVAYIVVPGTIFAHGAFTAIAQRHPFPRLAPFMLIAPVLGSVLGVLLLGDVVSSKLIFGGLLTLAGVLIITLREAQKAAMKARRGES